jgi:hypothetical protein
MARFMPAESSLPLSEIYSATASQKYTIHPRHSGIAEAGRHATAASSTLFAVDASPSRTASGGIFLKKKTLIALSRIKQKEKVKH